MVYRKKKEVEFKNQEGEIIIIFSFHILWHFVFRIRDSHRLFLGKVKKLLILIERESKSFFTFHAFGRLENLHSFFDRKKIYILKLPKNE